MRFLSVPHGSPLYHSALKLRDETLRKPLGLTYSDEQLAAEVNDHHLVALTGPEDDPTVVAGLILSPVADQPHQLHLRQMTVADSHRGHGLGRNLMNFAENFAREQNATEIKLHARDQAIPFYEKLGYHPVGPPFIEVTIPHQEMRKSL
ncbi:MAG: GNAT family N-acetyltransferase [Verrucomicrobiota bacterium]